MQFALAVLCLALWNAPVFAAEETPGFIHDVESSTSLRSAYWSDSRIQDDRRNLWILGLWERFQLGISNNSKLVMDGRLGNRGPWQPDNVSGDLREAFLALTAGPWDLSAGRQMIVWGKADGINPTDNLAVRDFSLLTPEDADQKSGVISAKLAYTIENCRISAYWLPEFRPNKLPISDTDTTCYIEAAPEHPLEQWAVRFDSLGEGADWSISYYNGYDKNPDFSLWPVNGPQLQIGLDHHRIRVLGADTAFNLDRFGVRAEAAYTWTEDPQGIDPFMKNSFFYGIMGADRTFADFNVNAQVIFRYIDHFADSGALAEPIQSLARQAALSNNQFDETQLGLFGRIGRTWWNDTLETEVAMLYWFRHNDYLVRPKIKYAWTDTLKTIFGSDQYRGPENSAYGNLKNISTTYLEMQLGF
jgi:hypothetical protein